MRPLLLGLAACFPQGQIELPLEPGTASWFVGARTSEGVHVFASTPTVALALDDADTLVFAPSAFTLAELGLEPGRIETSQRSPTGACPDLTLVRPIPSDRAMVRAARAGDPWLPLAEEVSVLLSAWLEPLPYEGCTCVEEIGDTPLACRSDCETVEVAPPMPPEAPEPLQIPIVRTTCADTEVEIPGGCLPLGAPCAGPWPVTGDPSPIHVRPGAVGGDGSIGAPYGTIREALEGPPSATILLAPGRHDVDRPLAADATIIGCADATTIRASDPLGLIVRGRLGIESVTVDAAALRVITPGVLRLRGARVTGGVVVSAGGAASMIAARIEGREFGVIANTASVTIDGLEITGATHGIAAESSTITAARVLIDAEIAGAIVNRSRFFLSRALIDEPEILGFRVASGEATIEDVAILRAGQTGAGVQTSTIGNPVMAHLIARRLYVEDAGLTGVLIGGAGATSIETGDLSSVIVRGGPSSYHAIVFDGEGLTMDRVHVSGLYDRSGVFLDPIDNAVPIQVTNLMVTGSPGEAAVAVHGTLATFERIGIHSYSGAGLRLEGSVLGTRVSDLSIVVTATPSAALTIASAADVDRPEEVVIEVDRADLRSTEEVLRLRNSLTARISNVRITRGKVGVIYETVTGLTQNDIEISGLVVDGSGTGIDLTLVSPGATRFGLSKAEIVRCGTGARARLCSLPSVLGADVLYRGNGVSIDAE